MDFKSTIDLIIKDLNEASEIIEDLKKYPGVPALQVEFAKSKCKSAADVIAILKNLDNILPARNQEQKPIAIQQEENQSVKIPEQKTVAIPEQGKPPAKNQEEKIVAIQQEEKLPQTKSVEVKPSESKPPSVTVPPKETKAVPKKQIEKIPGTSLADKFTPVADLYEGKLNIKTEKDLSDKLKRKPITSLSDAIGINDRFLFITEIFEGNKESYSQAISRLDKAENLSDAMAIIMSYTGEKQENEAVLQLLDLVRLKLPADE